MRELASMVNKNRVSAMRTVTILVSALLIFADLFLDSPLFLQHFLLAATCATWGFVVIWLATVFNCWLGASHAGGSSIEGLPTLLLLFGVLAATALRFRWKFV